MPIVYALIARKKSVLAEFTSSSGNFPTVTRVLLSKIPEQDNRMSYEYDKHIFHYIVDDGITFLCMSDEDTKRRITFAFLDDIKKAWRERFGSVEQSALAFSLNDMFAPVLKQRMEYFNTNPNADKIQQVQNQIESVKDIMIENIDRVLERGEKIELLVDKTDRLNQQAFNFEKSSRSLKNAMLCRKIRNYVILAIIIALIIFFIAAMVCGLDFKKCQGSKDSK
jgi:vesicle-associated membrane protein 7